VTEERKKLEIAIYRRDPEAGWNVNELDVGPLLYELTKEPFYLANVGEDGIVKLEVQRTHEWEIVIGLVLTGSGIFLKGALTELGKRFGGWLADRVGKLGTGGKPEVRATGLVTVTVEPSELEKASKGIAQLLTDAGDKNVRVQIVVEPGQ
jgi:hypothetical protein